MGEAARAGAGSRRAGEAHLSPEAAAIQKIVDAGRSAAAVNNPAQNRTLPHSHSQPQSHHQSQPRAHTQQRAPVGWQPPQKQNNQQKQWQQQWLQPPALADRSSNNVAPNGKLRSRPQSAMARTSATSSTTAKSPIQASRKTHPLSSSSGSGSASVSSDGGDAWQQEALSVLGAKGDEQQPISRGTQRSKTKKNTKSKGKPSKKGKSKMSKSRKMSADNRYIEQERGEGR